MSDSTRKFLLPFLEAYLPFLLRKLRTFRVRFPPEGPRPALEVTGNPAVVGSMAYHLLQLTPGAPKSPLIMPGDIDIGLYFREESGLVESDELRWVRTPKDRLTALTTAFEKFCQSHSEELCRCWKLLDDRGQPTLTLTSEGKLERCDISILFRGEKVQVVDIILPHPEFWSGLTTSTEMEVISGYPTRGVVDLVYRFVESIRSRGWRRRDHDILAFLRGAVDKLKISLPPGLHAQLFRMKEK